MKPSLWIWARVQSGREICTNDNNKKSQKIGLQMLAELVSLRWYHKISEIINSCRERVCFEDSQFGRFQSTFFWLHWFGMVVMQHIMAGVRGRANSLVYGGRKQKREWGSGPTIPFEDPPPGISEPPVELHSCSIHQSPLAPPGYQAGNT